ncbi:MAG TPA: helix-turn-helix domain-containing GNAT family N-acetyltransferase [Candidatus Acidoferrales bacterium]|nr:helix-turn-helix domain-containing GNAT family N-acetyltransferase [Candidatus Acidoferrales bacterium]
MHAASHPVSSNASLPDRIAAVRRFNRFYTKQIGVLREGLLHSPLSLTEVRVLYELAHRESPLASAIARDLGMDAGYLSRILRDFTRRGLVQKTRSVSDARQSLLALTSAGRKAFATLDRRATEEVANMLRRLPAPSQTRLTNAMGDMENILGTSRENDPKHAPYFLRAHSAGDMGWIVYRHGVLYSQEYGYDQQFEALVARIVGEFIRNFDAKRERCWIAEREGEIVGSVFVVRKSKSIAKLRLLYVEPRARGLGIGRRLVDECIRFASEAGYKKITLWTQSHLAAARRIYKNAGFRLAHKEPHHSFSLDLVAETWDLEL